MNKINMLYHYLYEIRNTLNEDIYIGIHSTNNLDDGYMGSGKILHRAMKKYGRKNFKKTILRYFATREELEKAEEVIVTEDFIKRPDVYNVVLGGKGFRPGHIISPETRLKMSKTHSGKIFSAETKEKIRVGKADQLKVLNSNFEHQSNAGKVGGKKAVVTQRQLGIGIYTKEVQSKAGKIGSKKTNHIRWHANRNITIRDCEFCIHE
jgi:hypothetical protein